MITRKLATSTKSLKYAFITRPLSTEVRFSLKEKFPYLGNLLSRLLDLGDHSVPEVTPWDKSTHKTLRDRAAHIRQVGKCPVTGKLIKFTCPLSGIPTHYSIDDWKADNNYHKHAIWKILKKVNIYENDILSDRYFPEFRFPYEQQLDRRVNFMNWDTFLYTRSFWNVDNELQLAAVTKPLSYPITIASVLHQFFPYSLSPSGPATEEGMKISSEAAIDLNTPGKQPHQILIIGSRAESKLPDLVWKQLNYLFPISSFEINFIGPECFYWKKKKQYVNSNTPIKYQIDRKLTLIYHTSYFDNSEINLKNLIKKNMYINSNHKNFIFLFHPDFTKVNEEGQNRWKKTVKEIINSQIPTYVTAYNEENMKEIKDWLLEHYGNKMDILIEPTKNIFSSTKWEIYDENPTNAYQINQQLFAFKGRKKKHSSTKKPTSFDLWGS